MRVRYAELTTLLSISKGTVDMTWNEICFDSKLDLSTPLVFSFSKSSKKGINLRYAAFITSLSILKGTVDINKNKLEKWKIRLLLSRIVNSKFELSTLIVFSFSDAFRDEYLRNNSEISWTYVLLSIFKGAADWIKIVKENEKCESCLWIFNSEFELNTSLVSSLLDTFR